MLASCTQEESTNFFLPSQKKTEFYYVLKYFRFIFKSVRVVTGLLTFWKISGKFLEVSQKLCEWVLFQFFPGNFLKSVRVGTYPRLPGKINLRVMHSKKIHIYFRASFKKVLIVVLIAVPIQIVLKMFENVLKMVQNVLKMF